LALASLSRKRLHQPLFRFSKASELAEVSFGSRFIFSGLFLAGIFHGSYSSILNSSYSFSKDFFLRPGSIIKGPENIGLTRYSLLGIKTRESSSIIGEMQPPPNQPEYERGVKCPNNKVH